VSSTSDSGEQPISQRDILVEQFGQTRELLHDFIASADERDRQAPGGGDPWTWKELLAVMGMWMDYSVDRLRYYERGERPPTEVDFEALNRQTVAEAANRSWDDVVHGVYASLDGLTEAVANTTEEAINANNVYFDWPGGPYFGEVQANGFTWPLQEMEKYLTRAGRIALAERVRAALTPVIGARAECDLVESQALAEALERGDDAPIILDVRDAEEYQAGHLPGAQSLPFDELTDKIAALPAGRMLVTYCNMHHPGYSRGERGAELLAKQGYRAAALQGGFPGWQQAGLAVETGQADEAAS
jgi:phage shock protein E